MTDKDMKIKPIPIICPHCQKNVGLHSKMEVIFCAAYTTLIREVANTSQDMQFDKRKRT